MAGLVSILIPTYRYARYVVGAVQSALTQTYASIEVIVIDDASDDDTISRLHAQFADEPRVHIEANPANIGVVPNFNRCLERANGEFVTWLPADDWMLPEHVARLHALLVSEPRLALASSNCYFATADGTVYSTKSQRRLPCDYIDARDELIAMMTEFNPIAIQATLFRRTVLDASGAMDPAWKIAADWELFARLAIEGKRFGYLNDPSVCVRLHGENASGREFFRSGAALDEWLRIVERSIDHPGFARLRGRSAGVLARIDDAVAENQSVPGAAPIDAPLAARIATLRGRVAAIDAASYGAQVRDYRVSVIIPYTAYPAAVMRAIDSVAAQRHDAWDIVVVDQASVPIRQLLRGHPAWERIAYLRTPPLRAPGALRNDAVAVARGSYIAFLDEDNTYTPEHLGSLVACIEREHARVAVAATRLAIEDVDPSRSTFALLASADGVFRASAEDSALAYVANAIPLNAILAERGTLATPPFHGGLTVLEDFHCLMLLEAAHTFAWTGECTLTVSARLGLVDQVTGLYRGQYLEILDALYAAVAVPPEVQARRERHRLHVARVLAEESATGTPHAVAEFISTLAGRGSARIAPRSTAHRGTS